MQAVERAKTYIAAGDAFQIVPSLRLSFTPKVSGFDIYRALRTVNPSMAKFFDSYVAAYVASRGLKESVAKRMVARPVFYGGMMVKQGDAVTGRYRVIRISSDAVELSDVNAGIVRRLIFK